jgi:hypothetical protein
MIMSCSYGNSPVKRVPELDSREHEDGEACDDRLAALESRWTALPNRARSVVGEHPGGLKDTGTDAGSVLNAELAGSAPPQADGIVR